MKDLQQMMKQAQKMAADMQKVQAEIAEQEFEGRAGGGAATVTVSGDLRVLSVKLDPSLLEDVDPDDVEMIGDTITAAVNSALDAARSAQADALGPLAGGMGGLGLPGM